MRKITPDELKEILRKHTLWLLNDMNGERADLSRSNLSGSDLSGSNLSGSDLSWSNLSWSNLSRSNLSGSNLSRSNLSGSNLSGSDLSGSDLSGSNLSGSDLSGSNLSGSDLKKIMSLYFQICPEEGEFIAWKKVCNGVVLKLKIPDHAKRISTVGSRKCRASSAIVIEAFGKQSDKYDSLRGDFSYEAGKEAIADSFDDDPRVECSHGISFFVTRAEAEEWEA